MAWLEFNGVFEFSWPNAECRRKNRFDYLFCCAVCYRWMNEWMVSSAAQITLDLFYLDWWSNWVTHSQSIELRTTTKKKQQLEISLNQLASKYLLFKMMLWLPHATIWLRFHSFVMLSLQRTFLIESPISLDVFIWWIVCQSTTCELILCFVLLFSRLFFFKNVITFVKSLTRTR